VEAEKREVLERQGYKIAAEREDGASFSYAGRRPSSVERVRENDEGANK